MRCAGAAADVGLGRRLAGLAVDACLALATFALLNLLLYRSGAMAALLSDPEAPLLTLWLLPAAAATALGVLAVWVLLSWRLLGATPGGVLMSVTVVGPCGERPGWLRCAVRLFACLALAGLGLLWSLGGRPALHDRASGTRLVADEPWFRRGDPGVGFRSP